MNETTMKRIPVNGIEMAFRDEGAADDPAVVLLHGFPDTHRLWHRQIPALVDAGYRVIAPDQRGFGATSRPAGVDSYSIVHLVGDVLGLLDGLDIERAHVVGHDWGAAVAWVTAALAPERVNHLVALSVGHPTSFGSAGLAQREKSWYMLLFQFEEIAERWLSADDFANFRAWGGHPDVEAIVAEMSAPGALTAGLNWYRANVPPSALVELPIVLPPVQAATMGIWSTGDPHLLEPQMLGSAEHVAGAWRYERLEDAGHWMQLDAPETLNALLVEFLP